eukprot:1896505-Amphidinium_carterae.1
MSTHPRSPSQVYWIANLKGPLNVDDGEWLITGFSNYWQWLFVVISHHAVAGRTRNMTLSFVHGKLVVSGSPASASAHTKSELKRQLQQSRRVQAASLRCHPGGHLKAASVSTAT